MSLEQLRLEAKLTRELSGTDYSRYLELLRQAELAEKVMEIDDTRQKYIALSHLIDKVAKDLPGEIIKQREVLLSNHTLRFNYLCSDILPLAIYGGTSFSHCVNLLSGHRKEVEQWECDDEVTIAMRKAKLIDYNNYYIAFDAYDSPNTIYYRSGAYREYDEHKDSYYYRLGRMIQTHDADGGDLELTMQMACFYVALINERNNVEEELSLLGIDIPITQTQQTPRHEQPPLAEATDTPDVALPDFSQMNSYNPTIAFDMSALYSFLVAEGVIDGIDEKLFTNCITHAHINELWQKCGRLRKRNQLRCVINLLHTHHYKREWIESVARNLCTTPKKIYNPNRETLGDFEKKLRKII